MLYYIFDFLERRFDLIGAQVFQYISFRAGGAAFLSLIISLLIGKRIIRYLQKRQIGEIVRNLGLQGQIEKKGTPTMGGIIIIAAIVIPSLLFAQLDNIYVILMIVATLWMGFIGFLDDYIKVFRKNKEGLAGKFKVVGQIGLGLIVGLTLYFHNDVVIREFVRDPLVVAVEEEPEPEPITTKTPYKDIKSTLTTIPFAKNNSFDYSDILPAEFQDYTWVVYVLIVIFIVTAVSNGANITDGIDGLAAGVSAIIGLTLAIFAYVSGNVIFSDYLNIMYLPNTGELVVFCAAFVGACIGFLWFNAYPAQVFMGDTGSLSLGGIIAVLAFALRKEWLIPILCGIFLVENLSVMLQVSYFKYTKKKYGEGRRIFKMSPLHHHYQKMDYHESKIVSRFWIVGILLAIITLTTLKLR
ncbi:phospho-N-acetylmuramoyl-pentapeptide-transferase [Cesiribacter sp. SM1]|uniref:phospho-N-acetylmuramoyl-pentapeptide- transferase n=1 Tax=Cesiribacter sp. SM1 TaxID=2861196 RepID=UPI001CD71434|nr:phospho-N-acetylmuramoyl-pentapeptide-transferase [Cesiribacter sp. SM1]